MVKKQNNLISYYKNLQFPKLKDSLFFYSSFVATIDGKVYVDKEGYWPIGSSTDYDVFTILRAHADIIIDGKNTALRFGKYMLDTIHSEKFLKLRKELGKKDPVEYAVISRHPDEALIHALKNTYTFRPLLLTSDQTDSLLFQDYFRTERIFSEAQETISQLITFLKTQNHKNVFLDCGPSLISLFLEKDIIHDLFVTIAPKIYGSEYGKTLTMVEGKLLKDKVFKLVAVKQHKDELFIHYKKT